MSEADTTPLAPPGDILGSSDMRVQEMMYGHRFTTDQEPYMILLETLTICAEKPLGTVESDRTSHEALKYGPKQRQKMRYLVFSDRHLERIAKDDRIPDNKKWEAWKKKTNERFDSSRSGDDQYAQFDHFKYLDEPFNRDIHALLQAIRILRSQEIDVANQRRWTSRFLAVKGPDMVCDDLRESVWSRDRRFFARGGELVYLMLNRSTRRDEAMKLIKDKLLNPESPMNRIARAVSDPESDPSSGDAGIGYLPLGHHDIYDQMAEDWINILSIDKLPHSHLFEPLFRLTGLNLMVYFAQRSQEILDAKRPEPIVADAQNGADIQLRESAKDHLIRHRTVANRAVEEFIRQTAEQNGWSAALNQKSAADARGIIDRVFLKKKGKDDKKKDDRAGVDEEGRQDDPEEQLRKLIKRAQKRDKNNISTFLLPLTKGIGLVTARPGPGTWFALDDAMITALVLANVSNTNTVELREFARRLYDRYGLVIGLDEAREEFGTPPVGMERFRSNLAALENRMTRLALTRRLSDDCAFVVNPYR